MLYISCIEYVCCVYTYIHEYVYLYYLFRHFLEKQFVKKDQYFHNKTNRYELTTLLCTSAVRKYKFYSFKCVFLFLNIICSGTILFDMLFKFSYQTKAVFKKLK